MMVHFALLTLFSFKTHITPYLVHRLSKMGLFSRFKYLKYLDRNHNLNAS